MINNINNNTPISGYNNPNDANSTEREIQELLYELRNNPTDTNLLKEIYNKLLTLRDAGFDVSTLLIHTRKEIEQGSASKEFIGEMMNTLINGLNPAAPVNPNDPKSIEQEIQNLLYELYNDPKNVDLLKELYNKLLTLRDAGFDVTALLIHTRKEIEQGYASKGYIGEMMNTLINGLSPANPSDPKSIEQEIQELLYELYNDPKNVDLLKEIYNKLLALKDAGFDVTALLIHTRKEIEQGCASKGYIGEMMNTLINGLSPVAPVPPSNDPETLEKEIRELLYELYNDPKNVALLKEIYNKLLALRDAGYDVSTLLIHTRKEIEQGYASKGYIGEMMNTLINGLSPVVPAKKQSNVDSLFAVLFLLSKASTNRDALRRFIESITTSSKASDPDKNAHNAQTILPNKA